MEYSNQSSYRIYYEDTDAAGVVYHANYLKFMERGRTDWLRALKLEQRDLQNQYGIVFVMVASEISFRKPAKFDDQVTVKTDLLDLRGASVRFEQEVSVSNVLVCSAVNVVGCVDMITFVPKRIPHLVRRVFQGGG